MDCYRRAIALEPGHEGARKAFAQLIVGVAEMNQHELPGGYLGNAEEDAADLAEAARYLAGVADREWREQVRPRIAKAVASARAWVAERAGSGG